MGKAHRKKKIHQMFKALKGRHLIPYDEQSPERV
jgi:hypothetical protein